MLWTYSTRYIFWDTLLFPFNPILIRCDFFTDLFASSEMPHVVALNLFGHPTFPHFNTRRTMTVQTGFKTKQIRFKQKISTQVMETDEWHKNILKNQSNLGLSVKWRLSQMV